MLSISIDIANIFKRALDNPLELLKRSINLIVFFIERRPLLKLWCWR